jgi:hypothetical protein
LKSGLVTAAGGTTVIQINTINLARKGEACWLEEESSLRESLDDMEGRDLLEYGSEIKAGKVAGAD